KDGRNPIEIRDWIHSHPEIFYGVSQASAAQTFLANEYASRYESVLSQVDTLEVATGRAAQTALDSLRALQCNPLITTFFDKLSNPSLPINAEMESEIFRRLGFNPLLPSMRPESYRDFIAKHPELRERLQEINLVTLGKIIQEGRIELHELPKADAAEKWSM